MKYKWLGPYSVTEANLKKSIFKLAELDGVNLEGIFAGRKLKRFTKNFDNNQRTPKKGPLYKKKELDTSEEKSDQSKQTPLKMTIEKNNEGCLKGNNNQTTLLPYPLAKYVSPGRDFAVII